jgi:hypothetical protein
MMNNPQSERENDTLMFAPSLSLTSVSLPPDLWHFTFLTFQTNMICFLYFSMCLVGHLLGNDTPLLAAWIPYVLKGGGEVGGWK